MPAIASTVNASFRDPAGAVVQYGDRIIRIIGRRGLQDWAVFESSEAAAQLRASGKVVQTRRLNEVESHDILLDAPLADVYGRIDGKILAEHERVPFPNYPYEWAPEMLHAAGELTLEITGALLQENAGLKDATPYNVMFRGPSPVFLDVLSLESRSPADPTWLAYAQFTRTFVLPLLAHKHLGVSLDQAFLSRRDGYEPEDIYRALGFFRCLRPPLFGAVLMPALLSSSRKSEDAALYGSRTLHDPEKARFILETTYGRLKRSLNGALRSPRSSAWSGYVTSNNYTEEHFAAKEKFVEATLRDFKPRNVLDIGCNTGHFSLMAAGHARVISIDYDAAVIGELWNKARIKKADVLPLVVNITRPTPGIGWRNRECASFLDRARGRFDLVLMLAVIHHMLVTERVPLNEIIDLLAELTTDLAVVEFISPEDSMFQRILRGREELHRDLTVDLFEAVCRTRFEILRVQKQEHAHRSIYLLRRLAV